MEWRFTYMFFGYARAKIQNLSGFSEMDFDMNKQK